MNSCVQARFFRAAAILLAAVLVFFAPLPAQASQAGASGSDASVASGADTSAAGEAGEDGEEESGRLFAPDYEPKAAAVCLVNEESGIVVYENNADAPLTSASLVKMMTCMLAVEYVEKYGTNLDDELVTSDKTWIYDELYGKNASTADIRKGETLSVRELLYAALLPSANEAALLLADLVSGGYLPNFIYMMNARAKNLGCTGTVFTDPNGLDEGNQTTARDMVLIARAFFGYPALAEIVATPSYEMAAHEKHDAPYYILNTNRLIVPTSPYYGAFRQSVGTVLGGKTGSLGEWQNFVSMAQKDGMTYICAVMHSPHEADAVAAASEGASPRPALYEAAALYDWAFRSLEVRPAIDVSEPVTEIRVRFSSTQDTVRLMPSDDVKALLPTGAGNEEIKRYYDIPEYLDAPVEAGQLVGSVTLVLDGQMVGTAQLTAERSVERNSTLYTLDRVGQAVTSLYLRVLIVVAIVAVLLYVGIMALLNRMKANKKRKKRPAAPPGAAQKPRRQNANDTWIDSPFVKDQRPPPQRRVYNQDEDGPRRSSGG